MVCLLLSHMPDIDINDRCQKTPAHYAAYNGEVLCLEVLANSGKCANSIMCFIC